MLGLELIGLLLVLISIIYAFIKKKEKTGLALITVLLALLFILNKLGRI